MKWLSTGFLSGPGLFLFLLPLAARCQNNDEEAVRRLLGNQTEAWNRGSIDDFMKTYWNNDSLMFIGKSGVTYGYKQTLENYKKHYPDTAHMGKLFFDIVKLQRLSPQYYFVVGRWYLHRSAGDIGGMYDLLIRKINGQWKIVSDHSS